jgi:hypothetical protein
MAWCLPEAGDDGDDGEKGFALSRVVKRTNQFGKNLGHGLVHVGTSFLSWKTVHSCSATMRDSPYPLNVQHTTIRKGDSTALCVHAEDLQVLQLIQFSRIFYPPY